MDGKIYGRFVISWDLEQSVKLLDVTLDSRALSSIRPLPTLDAAVLSHRSWTTPIHCCTARLPPTSTSCRWHRHTSHTGWYVKYGVGKKGKTGKRKRKNGKRKKRKPNLSKKRGNGRKNLLELIRNKILPRFIDNRAFVRRRSLFSATHPYFWRKFQGVSLVADPWCLDCKERTSQTDWPWNYFRRIPTYVITIHQRHRRTDRQTDGLTTCDRNTALYTKVHRTVKTAVYHNVNGDRCYRLLLHRSKTAKMIKVILLRALCQNANVLLSRLI